MTRRRRSLRTGAVLALGAAAVLGALPRGPDRADPVILESRGIAIAVAAPTDDATEVLTSGLVELQSADLELGEDAEPQLVALRFANVGIPAGSTVESASIQFASARYSDPVTVLEVRGEASDDATSFSRDPRDLSSRPTTDAVVPWEPETWRGVGEVGPAQRTPDLAPVIAEIVSRPGWDAGNALVVLIRGSGTRAAESYDGPLALPPVLRIAFDGPSGSNAAPDVDAGRDLRVELGDAALLVGTVTDDGSPGDLDGLTLRWSTSSGPGQVVFTSPSQTQTAATFPEVGTYVVSLIADDGEIAREDQVEITVVDTDAIPPPSRFVVIGDYGLPGEGEAAVAALVERLDPDFVVTVGDNVYVPDIDEAVGAYYSDFIGDYTGGAGSGADVNRFFPAIGNHEYTDPAGGLDDYLEYFTLPGEGVDSSDTSGNERYYDFVQGPVHVFVLNSNTAEPDGRSATSVQAQWLETQLAASASRWKLVVMHHAPYTSVVGGSTELLRWPFAAWGADAVMSGHAHVYERLDVGGIPYFVNGIGGEGVAELTPAPLPQNRLRYNGGFGAMLVEACAERLEFSLISVHQSVVDTHALGATDCAGGEAVDDEPYVHAGLDRTAVSGDVVALDGVAADDGGDLTVRWSEVRGPGSVRFADPGRAATAVRFGEPGPYVLRLTATDDAGQQAHDEIEIVVTDATYRAVTVAVAGRDGDAEQRLGTGEVRTDNADLGLGEGPLRQLVGLRFADVDVPRGAIIERAYVQFGVDTVSRGAARLDITAERSPDAARFSSRQLDISARPTVSRSVEWLVPEWLAEHAAGPDQRSPDLAAVLQEVVDQPGWSAGNAVAVLVSGTGTRTAEAVDRNGGGAPVLHVEYRIG